MKKIIVANWKMYLNRKNSLEFLRKLKIYNLKLKTCDLIICPSFLVISQILNSKYQILNTKFGAQDCFWQPRGAYTGEVSPPDLKEAGCKYVIIGHSERRHYFKETDEMINLKIKAAQEAGLTAIFCLGETLAERQKGQAGKRVGEQLKKGLAGLVFRSEQELIIAYEPVWAIGTGNFCPPKEAVKMHRFIKGEIKKIIRIKNAPVLYGGSVDEKNVGLYLKFKEIDGVLVGGASTKPESFFSIIDQASRI